MGDVIHLDGRRLIQETAAEWLSKVDRGLNEREHSELREWLGTDPRHADAFVELAATWDNLEQLSALSGLIELRSFQTRRRRDPIIRIAAALALLGVTISLWAWTDFSLFGFHKLKSPPTNATAEQQTGVRSVWSNTYKTKAGEVRQIALPDGSVIELNTRSMLKVFFNFDQRQIEMLEGEATFKVAHDTSRPFIVQAAGRRIRAVGTVFTVRAKSDTDVSVIVSEGRVAVSDAQRVTKDSSRDQKTADSQSKLLRAGERLEVTGPQVQFAKLSFTDIEDALAWQNGMIVFQGEPLAEAVEEISRYSDARFEIPDSTLRSTRVAGVYRINDLTGFVESLRSNLGVRARYLPDGKISLYRISAERDVTAL